MKFAIIYLHISVVTEGLSQSEQIFVQFPKVKQYTVVHLFIFKSRGHSNKNFHQKVLVCIDVRASEAIIIKGV